VAVTVNVALSPEESELQAPGLDVLQQMFEQDAAPAAAEELAADEATEGAAAPAEAEAPADAAPAADVEETAEALEEGDAEQA